MKPTKLRYDLIPGSQGPPGLNVRPSSFASPAFESSCIRMEPFSIFHFWKQCFRGQLGVHKRSVKDAWLMLQCTAYSSAIHGERHRQSPDCRQA